MESLEEEVRRLREYEKLRPQLLRQVHALRRVQSGDAMPQSSDHSETVSPIRELRTDSGSAPHREKHDAANTTNNLTRFVFSERPLNPILCDPQVGIDFVLMQVDTWNCSDFLLLVSNSYYYRLERSRSYCSRMMYANDEDTGINNPDILLSACSAMWRGEQSNHHAGGDADASRALERLLQCSLEVHLPEVHITPVQIWDLIRSHSLASITAEILAQATAELCRHGIRSRKVVRILCHMFMLTVSANRCGTVLERSVVMPILDRYILHPKQDDGLDHA
jgi:hypothetical protein